MSSYHSSFTYNGANSASDKNLIIVAFEPDNGFKDTFLSMDVVSDKYYDGTKIITYGSKYNTTANIEITLIKNNRTDISLKDFREYAKWLTGSKVDSWLNFYVGDTFQYAFLGRITDLQQYKFDARTVGLKATFSSVTPWAFSEEQYFDCHFGQKMTVDENGVLSVADETGNSLSVDSNGTLYASLPEDVDNNYFLFWGNKADGTIYIKNTVIVNIDNQTDDLYTYINLDMTLNNKDSTYLSITNSTLDEETLITNMKKNECVMLSAKQFIVSDIPNKIFGDDFNFVWPRLSPGLNKISILGNGGGNLMFSYRYPMKVGDCTMNVSTYNDDFNCGDPATYDTVKWENIINTPTTIGGYGITDAYTTNEVDDIIDDIRIPDDLNIDEDKLNKMLNDIFN